MPIDQHEVIARFEACFGEPPQWVVRAPGRVNVIGEHTDYNQGFVLPVAIDRAVWIGLRRRDDGRVRVDSLDYNARGEFSLAQFEHENAGWLEYVKGTAWAMQQSGHELAGWEGVLLGDVPQDAGLSSSAALEVAVSRACAAASNAPWEAVPMAKLAQQAENGWVGMQCGIMDQLASAAGRAGRALLIDCRSLEIELVPVPETARLVVLDTATRRGLVDSEYNQRRAQCEEAAAYFGVESLRGVSPERFQEAAQGMDEITCRRARHVITENDRTLQAAEAMRRGDTEALGVLMNKSHDSLCEDFQVCNDELNIMVELARQHEACYGARMTGAGFGGCAVALVRREAAESLAGEVALSYQEQTGLKPSAYVCAVAEGAEVMDVAA